MRFILDFDDTIFDLNAFRKNTYKLLSSFDVSPQDWQNAWSIMNGSKYLGKALYSIEEHANRFAKQTMFDKNAFIREYYKVHKGQSYLFSDTVEFLEFLKKIGQVFLLTYGDQEFQSWKIKSNQIQSFFDSIEIVSSLKAHNLKKSPDKHDPTIFIDDKAVEIDAFKKIHPSVICIKSSRPGSKHSQDKSKYQDFEIKNFTQAKTIIHGIKYRFTSSLDKAVSALESGQTVVYPTDTAYGLGVDGTNITAVRSLYKVKGREKRKPVHIVVDGLVMAKKFAKFDKLAERLFKNFMPGALTLVLPLQDKFLSTDRNNPWRVLSAGIGTIGLRMPDNRVALQLVKKLGRPISTPSANPAGGDTPYSVLESYKQFVNKKYQPDLYLDTGFLPKRAPSTVVLLNNGKIEILRHGPISKKQIQKLITNN